MLVCPVCEHQQVQPGECEVCGKPLGGGRGLELPLELVPELDRGRDSIGDVAVEALGDLDTGRFDEPPAQARVSAEPVSCRYCRHVQPAGLLCEVCGMRLPRYRASLPEDVSRVLHACGTVTRPGRACSSCGVYVPSPSE